MLKLFISLFIILSLDANALVLARLESTISNEKQKFALQNYTFECRTYGILTLESLYSRSKKSSLCQKNIDAFYKKNPKKRYFTDSILKYKQLYHIQYKKNTCIVYAKGQVTLSELLLREGLAITKPLFRDEEFLYYYTTTQKKAKINKKGLWNTDIFTNCVEELLKNN